VFVSSVDLLVICHKLYTLYISIVLDQCTLTAWLCVVAVVLVLFEARRVILFRSCVKKKEDKCAHRTVVDHLIVSAPLFTCLHPTSKSPECRPCAILKHEV
jgi:hypothetical protein